MLKRGLAENSSIGQQVAERTVNDGVRSTVKRYTVATSILTTREGVVQYVGAQRFFGFHQGLCEVTSVNRSDADVVAILNKHLGQCKGQAIYCVYIALEEEYTTLLIRYGATVRKERSQTETVQNRLFVVVTGNAVLLAEHAAPLVGTLIIDSVKTLVENRLNN